MLGTYRRRRKTMNISPFRRRKTDISGRNDLSFVEKYRELMVTALFGTVFFLITIGVWGMLNSLAASQGR